MLWYYSEKWQAAHYARKNLGLDAILCCPGPSLTSQDLRGKGRLVFAINSAYPTVKPDVWLGMDEAHCYNANIYDEPFIKIFRGTYANMRQGERLVRDCPQTFFADVAPPPAGKTMFDLRDQNTKFAWHYHTLGVALHTMIWMGAKNIYLVGCDMGGDQDYCHDLKLTDDQRAWNRRLYAQQIGFVKAVAAEGQKNGINLICSTVNSPLNKFLPYVSVSQLLQKHTYTESKIRHVLDRPCTPVTVLRSGGEYKPWHVQRLAKQVPGLVCFSDVPIDGVKCIPLSQGWPGWWSKMELFGPGIDGDILHIDLDTTVRNIEPFLKVGKTTLLSDFYFSNYLASGLMYIKQSDKNHVYREFLKNPQGIMAKYTKPPLIGDQGFLNSVLKAQRWQDVLPGRVVSYKVHGLENDADIVCFHGKPRPWDIEPIQSA
jgi:hypothetical protein